MRSRIVWMLVVIAAVGTSAVPGAQSTEERVAARAVVAKFAPAVLPLRATVRMQGSVNGKDLPPRDSAIAVGATVIDPSGLAVLSLSRLEPEDTITRTVSQMAPTAKVDLSSDVSNVQMRLPNGREVPAHIVLRDQELDLAFVRPEAALPSPLRAIDAPSAKPEMFDLLIVLLRGPDPDGTGSMAGLAYVDGVIQKPRLYFSIAGTQAMGSPVFDKAGQFVGLIVRRRTNARGGTAASILPADDLREIAKQAK